MAGRSDIIHLCERCEQFERVARADCAFLTFVESIFSISARVQLKNERVSLTRACVRVRVCN